MRIKRYKMVARYKAREIGEIVNDIETKAKTSNAAQLPELTVLADAADIVIVFR